MNVEKKSNPKKKRSIADVGHGVPGNFKFGLIVAIAIFWAEFVRSILDSIFSLFNINVPVVTNLILAVVATILSYIVLMSYRRIKSRLQKIKM